MSARGIDERCRLGGENVREREFKERVGVGVGGFTHKKGGT